MNGLESKIENSFLGKVKNGFGKIKDSAVSKIAVYSLAGALSMSPMLGCDNGDENGDPENSNYSEIQESDVIDNFGEDLIVSPGKDVTVSPGKDTTIAPGKDITVTEIVTEKPACWEHIYDASGIASAMDLTNDGGSVIAGSTWAETTYELRAFKLDINGDIVWDKTFEGGSNPSINSIQQTNDNGYIMALEKDYTENGVWVSKLDSTGNLQWEKFFSADNITSGPYSIDQTTDNGYILTGLMTADEGSFLDARVLKLDSSGNIKWDKDFSQGLDNSYLNHIEQTNDGGYIAAGKCAIYGVGGYHTWVVKMDSDGGLDWDKTFQGDHGLHSIQQVNGGNYVMLSAVFTEGYNSEPKISKLDKYGNLDWEKQFKKSEKTFGISIDQTNDNGYIVAGHFGSSQGGKAWIFKTNSNGNLEWEKEYPGGTTDKLFAIKQTNDEKYVVAGSTNLNVSTQPWIFKIDGNGNLNCK